MARFMMSAARASPSSRRSSSKMWEYIIARFLKAAYTCSRSCSSAVMASPRGDRGRERRCDARRTSAPGQAAALRRLLGDAPAGLALGEIDVAHRRGDGPMPRLLGDEPVHRLADA